MSRQLTYDAVVVGSGFGGAISALRIAEAAKTVLVLERGKRYRPGEFPRDVRRVAELFWRYPRKRGWRGLYEVNFFSGIGTVTAAGVGGGSLIYANIHIRPHPSVFDDPRWPAPFSRKYLDPYYDRVAQKLSIEPVPADWDLPKRNEFRRAAEANGHAHFDPHEAVSWREPARAGQRPCQRVAECEFGCNYGAKNTLDFNYLADAERLGAVIEAGSLVTHVEPLTGGYRVHYVDVATGTKRAVVGRRVVLSAGTLGTHRILFNSRDRSKTLPNVSSRLGFGYSGNGDFLGAIQRGNVDLRPWDGPDVTTVIDYFPEGLPFTMAAPTFNQPVMAVLASLGLASEPGPFVRLTAPLFWKWLSFAVPLALEKGLLSRPIRRKLPGAGDPSRMTNLFAIGRDNGNGRVVRTWRDIDVRWRYQRENGQLIDGMTAAMRQIAAAYGGQFSPLATYLLFQRTISVHSLGGCHFATGPDKGVVATNGEVFGYPGLFIADGSVIPSSIGFHPVMTIAATAEHTAEAVRSSFS
jgi:cholesterol oxidase